MLDENEDPVWDTVIVGAGLAGWSAAVSAGEHGGTALVIEKQAVPGGSTVLSGGHMAFAGTPEQESLGLEDDAETLYRDLRVIGGELNEPALVRAYADGQLDLYRWLVGHGVQFMPNDVQLGAGQSVPRAHRIDTQRTIDTLRTAALGLGTRERYETAVVGLEPDEQGWKVSTTSGQLRARTVVLASGGFSRSVELLEKYAPAQLKSLPIGAIGNVGDGLKIAVELGARVRDFEFVKSTYGTHPSTQPGKHELLLAYYLGAIIVNSAGERFVDESLSYKLVGDAVLLQEDQLAFQIFDAKVYALGAPGVISLCNFGDMLDRGLLIEAPTLEDLADKLGIPAGALTKTIETYNSSLSESGYDTEFDRRHLSHTAGELLELDTAPYYGFAAKPALNATYCGVSTDSDGRVQRDDGSVIPGLLAAGEIVGGFHGKAYMTGSSLGKAAFFGRRAGRAAVAKNH